MIVKENIYTLAMAYGLAKRQLAYYRKTKQRYFAKMYEGIIISFEERFKNINEDIDLLSYFGETA
jgi:uncharacterized protein YhfF